MIFSSSGFYATAVARINSTSGKRVIGQWGLRIATLLLLSGMLLCTEESTGPVELYEPTAPVWGAIEGTVVDQDGSPIRGVCVYSIPRRARAQTDSQGKFRLTRLDSSYSLRFRRVGFAELDTFTNDSGDAGNLEIGGKDTGISVGEIKMGRRGHAISGRAVFPDGAPVPGAGIEIVSEDRRTRADPDGRFTISGLLSDTGTILAALRGSGSGSASYHVTESETAPILITLRSSGSAAIEGRIEDGNGIPMGRVVVRAVARGLVDTTDSADGTFRLSDVPVGESIRLTTELGHAVEGLIADSGGVLTGLVLSDAHMAKWGRLGLRTVKIFTESASSVQRITAYLDTLFVPAPDTGGIMDSGATSGTLPASRKDTEPVVPDTVGYYLWDRNLDGQIDTITGANFLDNVSLAAPVKYGAATLAGHLIYGARLEAVKLPDSLGIQAPDTVFRTRDSSLILVGTAQSLRGGIARYSWDFDGDGIYDTSSSYSGRAEHRYSTPATYQAVFLVETTGAQRDSAVVTVIIDEPAAEPKNEESEEDAE